MKQEAVDFATGSNRRQSYENCCRRQPAQTSSINQPAKLPLKCRHFRRTQWAPFLSVALLMGAALVLAGGNPKQQEQLVNNKQQAQSLLLYPESAGSSNNAPPARQQSTRPATGSKQQTQQQSSPQNERLNLIEADENGIYLLGLFDVHHSNPRVPFKCGPIDADAGDWHSRRPMQNMEAFLWAIEQVNADKSLLPGVKLGALVMDTCSSFLRTNQQLANLLHGTGSGQSNSKQPSSRQIAAIVADNSDWQSVEAVASMASPLGLTTFVTQSRSSKLGELARRYKPTNELDLSQSLRLSLESAGQLPGSRPPAASSDLGLLSELLGIGKLPAPLPAADGEAKVKNETQQKLYMVRMPLGNELLAEALASLVQQMGWDLISVLYDDEPDLVDLHDELAKRLLSRSVQFALDEQIPLASPTETYDRLLQSLAKKAASMGARVVVTLLGTGSARLMLDSIRHLRNQPEESTLIGQVNSLLWVTVADREPYYAFATDALGHVAVSSSASLMPDFKSHYDQLAMEPHAPLNRWWPEYLRAVLSSQLQPSGQPLELLASECAKWLEPSKSPLNEKCRALSLSAMVQAERLALQLANNQSSGSGRLSKYLAGGWEHNGMDTINSVLAAANGLESVRQSLCPNSASGLCDKMRSLINSGKSAPSFTMSELIYQELLRSTFQLADGRMFNLDDFSSIGGQVEGRFKLYNLRYLQPNSIGFVKFGAYDQVDGLELNISKARYYPMGRSFAHQAPIELVKSSCQDESKCLMLGALTGSDKQAAGSAITEEELAAGMNTLFKLEHPSFGSDPPLAEVGAGSQRQWRSQAAAAQNSHYLLANELLELAADPQVHTMRSAPAMSRFNWTSAVEPPQVKPKQQQGGGNNKQPAAKFNTIVLLPLHSNKGYQSSAVGSQLECSESIDSRHSFQLLAALAYAQQAANGHFSQQPKVQVEEDSRQPNGSSPIDGSTMEQPAEIELTTTVIDYCDQPAMAKAKLLARLNLEQQQQQQLQLQTAFNLSQLSLVIYL